MSYLTEGRSRRPAYKLAGYWLALALICLGSWILVLWGGRTFVRWMAS